MTLECDARGTEARLYSRAMGPTTPIDMAFRDGSMATLTSRLCFSVAAILGITAVLLILAREHWASDLAAVLAPYVSADGIVTADGVERLRRWLLRIAFVASLVAGALLVVAPAERRHRLWQVVLRDDLLPNRSPWKLLSVSSAVGLIVILLWGWREMPPLQWLFRKEGPLEILTVIFLVIASLLCALSARQWLRERTNTSARWVGAAFALFAAGSLLVAMEEISWGQQILGFSTPEGWARLNHQQETTLHNLVDKNALTRGWEVISFTFAIAVSSAWVILAGTRSRLIQTLLPHPALVPLALLIGLSGTVLHPEIAEFLIAFFAMCYALRAHRIAVTHSSI